ncbi:hypothetical protein KI387_036011, partial [Taxus chinensis]
MCMFMDTDHDAQHYAEVISKVMELLPKKNVKHLVKMDLQKLKEFSKQEPLSRKKTTKSVEILYGEFVNLTTVARAHLLVTFLNHVDMKETLELLGVDFGRKNSKRVEEEFVGNVFKGISSLGTKTRSVDKSISRRAILTSVVSEETTKNRHVTTFAKALGLSRKTVSRYAKRRKTLDDSTMEGNWALMCRNPHSDKIEDNIVKIVSDFWTERTHPSSNVRDVLKHKVTRNNYDEYIKHWLEITQHEMYIKFTEENSDVKIGQRMFENLKPWYVRTDKVLDTCCCRYHVEFDYHYQVYRKLREEIAPPTRVSEFITSIICNVSDDHVDDRMTCIKGEWKQVPLVVDDTYGSDHDDSFEDVPLISTDYDHISGLVKQGDVFAVIAEEANIEKVEYYLLRCTEERTKITCEITSEVTTFFIGSVVVQGTYLQQVKSLQSGIHFVDYKPNKNVYHYTHHIIATGSQLQQVKTTNSKHKKWRLDVEDHENFLQVIEQRAEPLVWCRRTDELVDGPNATHITPATLDRSERRLEEVSNSRPYDMLDAALSDTISNFPVDIQPFRDMIEGMRMDLRKSRYINFDDLYLYWYYVAGTVGLMSVPVMGISPDSNARIENVYNVALALGIANWLMNILCDVGE